MSLEDFEAKRLRDERRSEFLKWCKENDEDPETEEAHERYSEIEAETGDSFWKNLEGDDRDGWGDNIIKSFD